MPRQKKGNPTNGNTSALSDRQIEVLYQGLHCFKGVQDGRGIVDFQELADAAGYSSPKAASRAWNEIVRKLAYKTTASGTLIATPSSVGGRTNESMQENPERDNMGGNQEVSSGGVKRKASNLTTTTNARFLESEEINQGHTDDNGECFANTAENSRVGKVPPPRNQGIDKLSIKGKEIDSATPQDHTCGPMDGSFNSDEHIVSSYHGEPQGAYDPAFDLGINEMFSSPSHLLPGSFGFSPNTYSNP
ncbi:hypothetical protein GGR51DRAFT_21285 [Nemania sp. FL0031]|nr:hypothetical protein GGR51DRAFT_21285 [Nemania sp. FL0031]